MSQLLFYSLIIVLRVMRAIQNLQTLSHRIGNLIYFILFLIRKAIKSGMSGIQRKQGTFIQKSDKKKINNNKKKMKAYLKV